jgi:ribosomal protein S18 acetylase RimI-like enzyme
MTIRPATPDDAASLAALSIEVWLGTYIREGVNAFFAEYALSTFTKAAFEAHLAAPTEQFFVSENRVGIDGYIRFTSGSVAPGLPNLTFELTTLYIQPRHQGRGLGAALLAHGLAGCDRHGAGAAWLAVNSENPGAIAFYERHGFTHAGQTHFRIQDQAYLNEIMARPRS